MKTLRAMLVRFAGLFRRKQREIEMNEELRAHLDALTERNVAAGMSPDEARYAALRAFGGVAQIAECARDERRSAWGEQVWQDLRYAVRQLRKSPGFTFVAMVSLALGIGANTAIFSVVNEVLLKSLPVKNPRELLLFTWSGNIDLNKIAGSFTAELHGHPSRGEGGAAFTFLTFQRFRETNQTLASLFAFATVGGHSALIDGEAEIVDGADYVSGEYFSGLGVGASLGRTITTDDDRPDVTVVAMISDAYWRRRFGGDATVLGRTVSINMTPVTIIGVTPPEFRGAKAFGVAPAFFLPLASLDRLKPGEANFGARPGNRWLLGIMGRSKPDMSPRQTLASFEGVFRQSVLDGSVESGDTKRSGDDVRPDFPRLEVARNNKGSENIRWGAGSELAILSGLVGLMLLIACTNVANLLLARGAARRKEIAVRLALGASRFRIVRQLLVESLVLACGGGVLGIVFAEWGTDALVAIWRIGGIEHVELDLSVLGFALAASLLTGVFFGLAPALRATRIDLTTEFQGGPRTVGSGGRSALRLGRILMIAQVALSLVVLVGAGLFMRTLRNLQTTDLGFAREHLLLFCLDALPAGFKRNECAALFGRIVGEVRTLPGVRSATFSSEPVVSGVFSGMGLPGHMAASGDQRPVVAINQVNFGFFETFGLPILRGRGLGERDNHAAPKVVVINQAMADRFWPGENPIGRSIPVGREAFEIVGLVPNAKYDTPRKPIPPTIYFSFPQMASATGHFAVRTTGAPAAIAAAIRQVAHRIAPNLPLTDVRTQDEQVQRLLQRENMFARLSALFGALALVLVCVGLHGLMSYAVLRRTGEIGVRMALGALPRDVLDMIVRESLGLVACGVVVGVAVAIAASGLVAAMLHGLSPTDPLTYGGVALLLLAVALLTALLPARRAAKIDPMVALRAE